MDKRFALLIAALINRIRDFPKEAWDELFGALDTIERKYDLIPPLSDADREAIEEGMRSLKDGKGIPMEEVEIFKRVKTFNAALATAGHADDDLLFYLAGIYNSQTAESYLEGGGANVLRIPLSLALIENGNAGRVIALARRLRNLHWLGAEAIDGMDGDFAESMANRNELQELGLEELRGSGGRFRQRPLWRGTDTTSARIDESIMHLRPQLDEAVSDLFLCPSTRLVTI